VTARARLESTYDRIRDMATQFWEDIVRYRSCSSADIPQSKTCIALLSDIERLAIAIGTSMEDAEDAARQGWLTPGEVRDARSTHGMDHSFWDELVRFVHQYRR
jgi:hypothetical protein